MSLLHLLLLSVVVLILGFSFDLLFPLPDLDRGLAVVELHPQPVNKFGESEQRTHHKPGPVQLPALRLEQNTDINYYRVKTTCSQNFRL